MLTVSELTFCLKTDVLFGFGAWIPALNLLQLLDDTERNNTRTHVYSHNDNNCGRKLVQIRGLCVSDFHIEITTFIFFFYVYY